MSEGISTMTVEFFDNHIASGITDSLNPLHRSFSHGMKLLPRCSLVIFLPAYRASPIQTHLARLQVTEAFSSSQACCPRVNTTEKDMPLLQKTLFLVCTLSRSWFAYANCRKDTAQLLLQDGVQTMHYTVQPKSSFYRKYFHSSLGELAWFLWIIMDLIYIFIIHFLNPESHPMIMRFIFAKNLKGYYV